MTKLYALFNDSESEEGFVQFVTEYPFTGTPKLKEFFTPEGQPVKYNIVMDWHEMECTSLAFVQFLATKATEQFGTLHVPTECDGRFGIVEVPRIGDAVSYTINADYRPCGYVERLTPTLMVITSTGMRFRRYKKTGAWVHEGTDYVRLVGGHIDERNPEV